MFTLHFNTLAGGEPDLEIRVGREGAVIQTLRWWGRGAVLEKKFFGPSSLSLV